MSPLTRPFRPVDFTATALDSFDLNSLAEQLTTEPQYKDEGKAGITLARDAHVSVVLQALRKGSELREHRAPASALVTLLSGRATFVSEPGAKRTEMVPGTLVAFSADLDHALVADEDSVCLIVIGGRAGRR
jgi:quercetin dioxygenase-like cupin family protein